MSTPGSNLIIHSKKESFLEIATFLMLSLVVPNHRTPRPLRSLFVAARQSDHLLQKFVLEIAIVCKPPLPPPFFFPNTAPCSNFLRSLSTDGWHSDHLPQELVFQVAKVRTLPPLLVPKHGTLVPLLAF